MYISARQVDTCTYNTRETSTSNDDCTVTSRRTRLGVDEEMRAVFVFRDVEEVETVLKDGQELGVLSERDHVMSCRHTSAASPQLATMSIIQLKTASHTVGAQATAKSEQLSRYAGPA